MERLIYDAESLTKALYQFEEHFGMSSREFYEKHRAGAAMEVPRFERHVWASFYEDVQRMQGGAAVMDRVSRTFAHD